VITVSIDRLTFRSGRLRDASGYRRDNVRDRSRADPTADTLVRVSFRGSRQDTGTHHVGGHGPA